jgi:uncharacterized protein (TIGR02217 family)
MQVFPTIRGLGFPVKRTPTFETLVQEASNNREVRLAYTLDPIWKWELKYNYIKDNPADLMPAQTSTDLQIIQGFYLQMGGRFQTFLYDDVTPGVAAGAGEWDSVTLQPIASGDGVTTIFPLIRTTGGFVEIIQAPYTSPHPKVYLNGVLKTYATDYSVDAFGNIIFVVAPGNGVAITATFSYYWPVRFDDDVADIDQFMTLLWDWQTVKLCQVRL